MLKSDIVAGTKVCARMLFPGPSTCTEPPLNDSGDVPFWFGITTTVTVAVEPDCKEGIVQLITALVDTPPQVPAVVLAETKVKGTNVYWELKLSVSVTLVARSGPLFVIV